MPEYLAPGVYVEEVSFRAKSIEGVGTSTTAFVGPTRKGPIGETPELITSFGEFERMYGGADNLSFDANTDGQPPAINYLAHAVRAFFDNGGSRLYVARVFQPRNGDDGRAKTKPFVGPEGGGADDVATFVARMPGSGLRATVTAAAKLTPASERTAAAAPKGTVIAEYDPDGGPATGATAVGAGVKAPFKVENDQTLEITTREGAKTITFGRTLAEVIGDAIDDPANLGIPAEGATLNVTIDGVASQVALVAADQTLDAVVAKLTAELPNATVRKEGDDRLAIASKTLAPGGSIAVGELARLGFPEDRKASTSGVVSDLDNVKVAEIQALLDAEKIPVTVTTDPQKGVLVLTTNAAGDDETLAVGGTARAALGLPANGKQGGAATPITYFIKSGDDTWGRSDGAATANDRDFNTGNGRFVGLSLIVNEPGGILTIYEDLGLDPAHPRWIDLVLPRTPERRADRLNNPIYVNVGANVKAPALIAGLLLKNGWWIDNADDASTFALDRGGNDGAPPTVSGQAAAEAADGASYGQALEELEAIEDISIIAAPGHSAYEAVYEGVQQQLISHAERMKYRIAVLDTPEKRILGDARSDRSKIDSTRAALYYPWVVIANPLARPGDERQPREISLPPSGFVTGIYARTDIQRGVWKAPANEVVRGALRFEREINFHQQEVLNPEGINCLRFFYGRGYRVWGARTASSDPEWKYVNVRRYFIYLERSIDRSTQWAVFEPNGEALWANITETVSAFLYNEWRNGALLGSKPEEAYFVRCDRSTMTQNDLDNGRLICLIGVAALKPAEFVIFRIGQKTADARS